MHTRTLLLSTLALVALGGCHRGAPDASKVLANVGGQKITQADFEKLVTGMVPDPTKVKTLLESPAFQAQKPQLVQQLALQRAVITWARQQGLDKDTAVLAQLEGAMAQTYFQAMMARRADPQKNPPADTQLLEMYQEIKGKNRELPPFEQIKPQLAQGYPQWRFHKELRAAVPITYADEIGDPNS